MTMSSKKPCKKSKTQPKAAIVTENKLPCVFCNREIDDEFIYGKLYSIGDIQCHYFCVLLSCCLVQKGKDEEGLFGFLYQDILAEVERSKKHKCSYCHRDGATLGCSVSQCRKQFHLPCGRERNAVSLFHGNYKSFCMSHAPKQILPENIAVNAQLREQADKRAKRLKNSVCVQQESSAYVSCAICYEPVCGYPAADTFWPPCCARDAWLHRECLQRMALSAGVHYLKCPLCNDKNIFYQAVCIQGYYVPDRDAAWELEQNAFAEIYERPLMCSCDECFCPDGRNHDSEDGLWDIKLCLLCGSIGAHAHCLTAQNTEHTDGLENDGEGKRYICGLCRSAAGDIVNLAERIEKVIEQEQAANKNYRHPSGPRMSCRMSLRRTKQRGQHNQTSTLNTSKTRLETIEQVTESRNTTTSRQELNLKSPKTPQRPITQEEIRNPMEETTNCPSNIENSLFSPVKMLEKCLSSKMESLQIQKNIIIDADTVKDLRSKFKKPRPMSVKKRIVNELLEELINKSMKESPKRSSPKNYLNSPKKSWKENAEMIPVNPINKDLQSDGERSLSEITNKNTPEGGDIQINKSGKHKSPNSRETKDNHNEIHVKTPDKIESVCTKEDNMDCDDSSNSTFVMAPEFLADSLSDDSLPVFETPKKTKTIDICKGASMEIFETDEVVNIDFVKLKSDEQDKESDAKLFEEEKTNRLISNINLKEKASKVNFDMESFKNRYLNEVDKTFKCSFKHKHIDACFHVKNDNKLSVIDFAVDAVLKLKNDDKQDVKKEKEPVKQILNIDSTENNDKIKRKVHFQIDEECNKKSKHLESYFKKSDKKEDSFNKIKIKIPSNRKNKQKARIDKKRKLKKEKLKQKYVKVENSNIDSDIELVPMNNLIDSIDLTSEANKTTNKKKKVNKRKLKTKLSLQNNDLQLKIKWKEQEFKLKIKQKRKRKKVSNDINNQIMKQCILNFSPESDKNNVFATTINGATPIKRKYLKQEKSPDNMVQTSLHSFFKLKP